MLTKHDLNVRDGLNNTALYYAVSNSFYEVTKVLLDLGASVDIKNSLGNTALHKAFMTKNMLIINLLLAHHATITVNNDHMQTPLYFAPTKTIAELGLLRNVSHFLGMRDFDGERGFEMEEGVARDIKE